MENKWLFKTKSDENKIHELSEQLTIHPVLSDLLIQRGVTNFEEARTFFRPSLEMLHDPFLMKDMDKAVERILSAIDKKERIMILGDYDVDGTTATALVFKFLFRLYDNIEYYIPDRYAEGYGISFDSIDFAAENNISLIISLDCGIKAVDKVEYGNLKGIDFIICDHHNPGEVLPPASAILDPKQKDCSYPDKSLSGCGVGFKLIQALGVKCDLPAESALESLDLLATSIAADIVPVTGENRILTRFGLGQINNNPSPGIKAMKEIAGNSSKEYTISDVVFKIAPRINSAGRMSSGKKAVEILTATNHKDAITGVQEINYFNETRKDTDRDITKQAVELVRMDPDFHKRKTTVLFQPDWHKGVIGIVASRMIEKYYRPTVIFTGKEGILSGSARSVRNFDLYSALEASSEYLLQFGGHMYAAGMTIREENLEAFSIKFDEVVSESIREEHLHPCIEIDAELELKDINKSFYQILKQFAPFGPGNMNPVFLSKSVVITEFRKLIDKNENEHLKCRVVDPDEAEVGFDVIGFGLGRLTADLAEGVMIDLVYHLDENTWNGKTGFQLVAKDLRLSN